MAKRIYKLEHDWRTSGKKINSKIMSERARLVEVLNDWRDKKFLVVAYHGRGHAIVDYENFVKGVLVCYETHYDHATRSLTHLCPHKEAFDSSFAWQNLFGPSFFPLEERNILSFPRPCYGDKPVSGMVPAESINKLLEDMIVYRIFKVLVDPAQVVTAYHYHIEEDV